MGQSVPACDAAHCLSSLQGLFNQPNLLVVRPSAPTFSAQYLHLHSLHDLKARLKVKSSASLPPHTRRPSPERYVSTEVARLNLHSRLASRSTNSRSTAVSAS